MKRFWSRIVKGGPGECWVWTGATIDSGYGKLQVQLKRWRAHVLSYVLHYGPVPSGLFVLHTCDNRPCVNPAHLYAGTKKQNRNDMVRRGRQPQFNHAGVRNPKAHLTEEAVRIIREDGRTALELARAFGVSRDAVYDIKHRRTWRHIP